MRVKLNKAVKMFFGNSSLEMVYFEAIANALDADATKINIEISINSSSQPETLRIKIEDNGAGFTDDRFKKFCNLFDVDETSHKGLGRLVYLHYFENVNVLSIFNETSKREFIFTEDFGEDDYTIDSIEKAENGTTLMMSNYILSKIAKHEYIQVKYLKNRILEEFYSRLYLLKKAKKEINISIKSTIEGYEASELLSTDDMLELEEVKLDKSLSLIDTFTLYYSIEEVINEPPSIITAISVDNRTQKIDIISPENLPMGYKMVFLLYSDWFIGKVDATRQVLTISDHEKQSVQKIFREKVATLINEKIPKIVERNKETKEILTNNFPHLSGYFNEDDIGYISQNEVLKKAQDKFFTAQRKILGANKLSEEQYEETIELSARALTEYILFRQITINKLKKIDKKDNEATIHNLIVPQYRKYEKEKLTEDLYRNNAWLLDDKFMTYDTVLSEKEMSDVISVITNGESNEEDDGKPDIALIFSNNPSQKEKVDVVIVELKKKGIKLENAMVVETQLQSRARKLMKYYNNKIQRIWFYGVVEFNDELELALSGEYTELYSTGKMYYREIPVAIQKEPLIKVPIGMFIIDLDSLVDDADARNSTFLNFLKSKFNK